MESLKESVQRRIVHIEEQVRALHKEREDLIDLLRLYTQYESTITQDGASSRSTPDNPFRQDQHDNPFIQREVSGKRGTAKVESGSAGAYNWANVYAEANASKTVTTTERVTEAAYEMLKNGSRYKVSQIYAQLVLLGIKFGGANPEQMVSTLLSKDGRFSANRRLGWGLEEIHGEADRSAPTDLSP